MDGFTAGLILWISTLCAAFFAGQYLPLQGVIDDCGTKGEIQIRSTFIQCKPVAVLVAGKRESIRESTE